MFRRVQCSDQALNSPRFTAAMVAYGHSDGEALSASTR